jgi:hypothetical protein
LRELAKLGRWNILVVGKDPYNLIQSLTVLGDLV